MGRLSSACDLKRARLWQPLAQPTRALGDYLLGATYVAKDRQFQHIDSLRYQALIRNPLMYLPLDAVLLDEWFSRVTQGELTIQELSSEFGPEMAAWWAYSRCRFNEPYFAKPYCPLAYLRESEGKDSVAIATYRRFIQIAPASLAGQVELARQRLGEAAPH
jgi:hypothetical protein